jgi:hypothetical protein
LKAFDDVRVKAPVSAVARCNQKIGAGFTQVFQKEFRKPTIAARPLLHEMAEFFQTL